MGSGIDRVRLAKEASDRARGGEKVESEDLFVPADDILSALVQLDDRLRELEEKHGG